MILSFIYVYLLPSLLQCANLIDVRIMDLGKSLLSSLMLQLPLGYTSYFLLGDYLNRYDIGKKTEKIIYWAGAFGFFSTIALTIIGTYRYEIATEAFFSNTSVNILLESLAVFVFVKKHADKLPDEKPKQLIGFLAKYSFGVYLIHAMILQLMQEYGFNTLSFNPLFSIPILSIAVLLISLACSVLISKIPILKRMI